MKASAMSVCTVYKANDIDKSMGLEKLLKYLVYHKFYLRKYFFDLGLSVEHFPFL